MSHISLSQIGSYGDGYNDDWSTIQSAVDKYDRIFADQSKYRLSQPLKINKRTTIIGCGNGPYPATAFTFLDQKPINQWITGNPIDGIVVMPGGRGSVFNDFTVFGDNNVYSARQPPDVMFDLYDPLLSIPGKGFVLHSTAKLQNITVMGFLSDGFQISSTDNAYNANGSSLTGCESYQNGRHGFYVAGRDANGCIFSNCCVENVGAWGFYERSFLGNTYIGCQSAENGHDLGGDTFYGGHYKTTGPLANNVFIGCYAEGDRYSSLVYPTMVFGGTNMDAGSDTHSNAIFFTQNKQGLK